MKEELELVMDEERMKKWEFNHMGMKCMVILFLDGGVPHYCGYVGLSPNSKIINEPDIDSKVNCHGSITFANSGGGKIREEGYFWVGFDCAHVGDSTEYNGEILYESNTGKYDKKWNLERTVEETKRLVEEILKYENKLEYKVRQYESYE